MEKTYTFSKRIVFAIVLMLIMFGIATTSIATTKLYTEGLKKGDILSFTKNGATSWCVYKNKADAKKTGIQMAVNFITPKDKITILGVAKDCNVLKVKIENEKKSYTGFIHYGSDAARYFEKVKAEVAVSKIKFDKTTPINMKKGEKVQVKASILPKDATYKTIEVFFWNTEWNNLKNGEESKTEIMKISNKQIKDGELTFTITAKKAGKATLYIRAINKNNMATCEATREVTISEPVVNVKKVNLNKDQELMTVGSSINLVATIEPENATDKTVTWKSSKEKVAKVDNNGKVTATGEGQAVITVTTKNGKTAKCTIYALTKENMEIVSKLPGTIVEKIEAFKKILSAKLSFENETETVTYGKETTIDFSKKLKGSNGLEIEYSSSNKKIATIDAKGIATINKNNKLGTTEIKAKIKGTNKEATCKLTVEAEKVIIESVSVKDKDGKTEGTLEINKTMELTAEVKENTGKAENQKMGYTNNNSKIVDLKIENGKIVLKGLSKGETTIVVRSLTDETKKAVYKVTVTEPEVEVTRVKINGRITSKSTMEAGEEQELKLEVLPENATNKEVEWKSSDEKIATVDQNGKVKALSAGTTKITAISKQNNKKKATCTITVKNTVKEINTGAYVKFEGCTEKWIVLYKDGEQVNDKKLSGVQLVSAKAFNVGKTSLGYADSLIDWNNKEVIKNANIFEDTNKDDKNVLTSIEKSIYSYNNAIENLNSKCAEIVKDLGIKNVTDVRCIGSNPTDKNAQASVKYSSSKLKTWPNNNELYKAGSFNKLGYQSDKNYEFDYDRLKELKQIGTENNEWYWFASRVVAGNQSNIYFNLRCIKSNGINGISNIWSVGVKGVASGNDNSMGLRPVITLDAKLFNGVTGSGTETDPFIIK